MHEFSQNAPPWLCTVRITFTVLTNLSVFYCHIDLQQFGSRKGTSTTYCLLDVLHNWLSSLDCPGKFLRVCFLLLAFCNRGRRNRLSDVIYSNGQNWMLNFNDSCLSHFHFLLENLVHHCFLLISIIYVRNCRLLLNIILELISLKKCQSKWVPVFSLQVKNTLCTYSEFQVCI